MSHRRPLGLRLSFTLAGLLSAGLLAGCRVDQAATAPAAGGATRTAPTIAATLTSAVTSDNEYIAWREHLIDGAGTPGGIPLHGGDGLVYRDVDVDGFVDVVAVYESDVDYGNPDGHVRLSFATADPGRWHNVSLARGAEAAGAEDAAVGDINGDGWPDVLVACELGHLLYLQNPGGARARDQAWPRLILPMTVDRGSYIRVAVTDLNGDGRQEVVAVNKGRQNPDGSEPATPISIFAADGDPLLPSAWREREIARLTVPINAEPVDIDGDGDTDLIIGSRGEQTLYLHRNDGNRRDGQVKLQTSGPIRFVPGGRAEGWRGLADGSHLKFTDLDGDGRLDVVLRMLEPTPNGRYYTLGWLRQPESIDDVWQYFAIGSLYPDVAAGFAVADIDGDGDHDLMTGGYSGLDIVRGGYSGDPRSHDGPLVHVNSSVGRIAWFENPGDPTGAWTRHDVSRRVRAMFDDFAAIDLNRDGHLDFITTRGNSADLDGLIWLEQRRLVNPARNFVAARSDDSRELPRPTVESPGADNGATATGPNPAQDSGNR